MLNFKNITDFLTGINQSKKNDLSMFHMLSFQKVDENTPQYMPPYQINFFQISYVKSSRDSSIKLNISDDTSIDKTIYFVSPEHIFSWKWEKDVDGYLIFVDKSFFNFSRLEFEKEFNELFDFRQENILKLSNQENLNLQASFDQLFADYHSSQKYKTQIIQSSLLSILYKLKNIYEQKQHSSKNETNIKQKKYLEYRNLITHCIIAHKKVKFYADKLNIVPNYLNEICKNISNKSAKQLIIEHILDEAKKMLIYTSYDISEVGFNLGYNEPTHFIRFFKQYEGITPNDFRKAHNQS